MSFYFIFYFEMTFIVGLYSHFPHVLTMKKKMALLVMMVYLVAQFSSTLQLQQSNESFNVPEESTTAPEEMSYIQPNSNVSTSSLVNSTSTSTTQPTFNMVLLAILLLSGLFVLQLCCIGCMLYDILKVPRETSNNRNRNAVDVKKKKNESKTQGPVNATLARPTPTSSTPQSVSPARPLVVTGGSQASGLNSSDGGSSIHDWQMSTGSTGSLTREISPTKSFVGAASSVASSNSNSKTSKKSTISANKSSNIKKK